jgi:hypothetical protein
VVVVMGDVFILGCIFHVPLGFKVGCPSSGVGCDVALVFIVLCVGLMAIFCGVTFFSAFLSILLACYTNILHFSPFVHLLLIQIY